MTDEKVVFVFQGGGALGAYQGGAAEAILAAKPKLDWIAGISIGAINSAILAGNEPDRRIAALRKFWDMVTSNSVPAGLFGGVLPRDVLNEWSAAATTMTGVPGFFDLRFPPAGFMVPGVDAARSFYDTAPLRKTLEDLVDFDRINRGEVRLSVGAVNVETGNMTWFDNSQVTIGPEHIMASGALPPGFPAVEIDGSHYWDGGLVSNTPLQYVLDDALTGDDVCIFQVDLFSARGQLPASVWETDAREKDIRFSSRTRLNTDMMYRLHEMRAAARRLVGKLPADMQSDPDVATLLGGEREPRIAIAHLIYRQSRSEHQSKDHEFSRLSMEEHWSAGKRDADRTLTHPAFLARSTTPGQIETFDLAQE